MQSRDAGTGLAWLALISMYLYLSYLNANTHHWQVCLAAVILQGGQARHSNDPAGPAQQD